jgi:arginyl-tRNA synthetase
MKSYQDTVREIIETAKNELALPQLEYELSHQSVENFGDISSNIALKAFALLKTLGDTRFATPLALAHAIVEHMPTHEVVASVHVAPPGFINISFTTDFLLEQVKEMFTVSSDYGKSSSWQGKTVIVEYSSPNIAKPFTIGHLRSTIIGDAIASLLEFVGAKVMRDNHVGDWGTQFGKQIYALKHLGKGDLESNITAIEQSQNPVKALVALYVEFHEKAENNPEMEGEARAWFRKLESGDDEARRLWQQCVDWSWVEFEKLYKKLDVHEFSQEFNNGRGLGESFFEDKMSVVLETLASNNLLTKGEEGAQLVFFPNDKFPPAMILKKDGATLYHTRDLATDFYRKQTFAPDLIINEVGSEQTLYFQQLFEMEYMLGWYKPGQRVHVGHGLIRFNDQKMSTRKGNTIWLEDVLNEATTRARALSPEADAAQCEAVGIGALKWNDLKRDPKHVIVFNWDELLSMDGNSGPYVQYTHARIASVLAKAHDQKIEIKLDSIGNTAAYEPQELSLMRVLYQFPHVIETAAQSYSPHLVCTYLFSLAQRFNSLYNQLSILGGNDQDKNYDQIGRRLLLTQATKIILHNGLQLLGIKPLERM